MSEDAHNSDNFKNYEFDSQKILRALFTLSTMGTKWQWVIEDDPETVMLKDMFFLHELGIESSYLHELWMDGKATKA